MLPVLYVRERDGYIMEALKAADPAGWTQRMTNITAKAEEIIREELICNG